MNDSQKVKELQDALKIAMGHWADWLDSGYGIHPSESEDRDDWLRCEVLSVAWTDQALGGLGG